MSRPASLVAATRAQTGMELRLTARRGENVLVTIVIPVVVLLFFASVSVLPTGRGRPVDLLLPGTLALAIIATSLVARTGNIYAGLAFPIVVALITVVVGSIFLRDQHNESIWAEVQPGANQMVSSGIRA